MTSGTHCPHCQHELGFWTVFGGPAYPIRCPHCKTTLQYRGTSWLRPIFFLLWAVPVLLVWLLVPDNIALLAVALVGIGPLLELPLTWLLRRRGVLEVQPSQRAK